MAKKPTIDELKAKYKDTVQWPADPNTPGLERRLAQRDAFDQHFAATSLGFMTQAMSRPGFDDRTRLLILISMFTAGRAPEYLEEVLRVALTGVVAPRDALEAIQNSLVYVGDIGFSPALDALEKVANDLGVMDEFAKGQLPMNSREDQRDLAEERKSWPQDVLDDPLLKPLLERYPWQGISTGIRFRGTHHLRILKHWDELDEHYAMLWETFAYRNTYSRDVLDGRMRILCTVGALVAVNAPPSAKEHIKSGLKEGVTPREFLELIVMTGVYFGFPRQTIFLRVLEETVGEAGRMDELGSPDAHPYDTKK